MQLHTMHPIELTDLLNGWGLAYMEDQSSWDAMLVDWHQTLQWALANGQNRIHWVLLEGPQWLEFSRSDLRQQRLKTLVEIGHSYGILVGVDVPIALEQQNAWRLIQEAGTLEDELEQIRSSVDWLMQAGFDYLATESGTSEFTHPDPERMLAWENELAVYLDEHWHRSAMIKIHCSTGQVAEGYLDPRSGEAINYNFLPHFADERLGVLPHTVQHYALDDPAPTYGNSTFEYMLEFMKLEAGSREVIWHPETAYWVSFDIDVPLFLPVYASRRVRDLRLIAQAEAAGEMGIEDKAGSKIDGQIVFSSGWEWGYWLNDVVAARAAWDPHLAAASDDEAMRELLLPLTRHFDTVSLEVEQLLIDTMQAQLDLLIFGKVDGNPPAEIVGHNGQAYLQGVDTWDDVSDLGGLLPVDAVQMTQPDRFGMVELRFGQWNYASVEPLLDAMEQQLTALEARYDALQSQVPIAMRPLFDDLRAAMKITAMRARQVHALYNYVAAFDDPNLSEAWQEQQIELARDTLDQALELIAYREQKYRVDAERIAAWRPNPTVYAFTYLWTVRSLYYWWRDEGKAVEAPLSPCYFNIIDPAKVAGSAVLEEVVNYVENHEIPNIGDFTTCLSEPASEPFYPPAGLRP